MKKKNGFTLIELLAVIIILGILMIIAIPSVTSYINNSRKSAYVDSAREIIAGARNFVNEGKVPMYDTSATYYIKASCISTENGQKSPYGEFVDDETYVIVTYDGKGYDYYWVSRDTTGQGVPTPTALKDLDEDDIKSDIALGTIIPTKISDDKSNVQLINSTCDGFEAEREGGSGGVTPVSNKICRRATSLHTATCSRTSNGCYAAGYYEGGSKGTTTITYGNLGTGETLTPGDAFDCDVNGDGDWDAATERFYYVTDNGDNAVLIYYTNVTGGTTATQTNYAYDSSNQNNHGPRTLLDQLPTTSQWSNNQLIAPGTRQITAETGATSTSGGTIESFTYTDKAARLLTTQELVAGCSSLSSVGSSTTGELDGCNYLMENLGQYKEISGTSGYWLETPQSSNSLFVWYVHGYYRIVNYNYVSGTTHWGVRPAITVLKSNISY